MGFTVYSSRQCSNLVSGCENTNQNVGISITALSEIINTLTRLISGCSALKMEIDSFEGSANQQYKTVLWHKYKIFISVINQLDAQNFCFTISFFHASTCFEHMFLKHVEAWNKLIVKQKFCASSWLITEINILRCTVSKSKKITTKVINRYPITITLIQKMLQACH